MNFIENQQGLFRLDFPVHNQREQFDDAMRVFVRFKDGLERLVLVEVEVDEVFVCGPAEFFHEPGLADLPRSPQDERFAILAVFPLLQGGHGIALHAERLLPRSIALSCHWKGKLQRAQGFMQDKHHDFLHNITVFLHVFLYSTSPFCTFFCIS